MKSIQEYSDYLLNCNFADDDFDPEDHEDHLKASWELFDNYSWEEIYPVWMQRLHEHCQTPADVINFVNLYIYYNAGDLKIPDPISLISYLYYRVDMTQYWDEAGELFDGLAVNILSKQKLVNMMEDPYYSPLKDPRIQEGIAIWSRQQKEG